MRNAIAATCVALLVCSWARAEKVALKLNLSPGMSWNFDQSQEVNTDNKATFNGQSQPFTTKIRGHRSGKVEVVAVSGGAATSIRVTFGEGCETVMEAGGQQQRAPFPYAGKTVTVTRGADGKVTDDANVGQVDPSFVSELHGMLVQEDALLPRQPVDVGEEWSADPKLLAEQFQLQGDDRAGMTLKLLGVKDSGGKRVAEVKVSAAVMRTINGLHTKAVMQGVAVVDLQTGHAGKMELKGTMETSGQQQGPGPNGMPVTYQIDGTGTIATTYSAEIGTAAPGGVAAANPLGGNPGGASNPLAPNPPADPFVGRFSDGNLTVELSGSNGSYSGTITLAGNKYPAKAKSSNQAIDGTFDAGGNSFPFSAKLDGNTMTLNSGGKTYTLKRAAVNPLGAQGPANATDGVAAMAGRVPVGYDVVVATNAGNSLSARKAGVGSVAAALQGTLRDLAQYFDGKARITSAYEDVRDHRNGGAVFAANLRGQPVKGLVTCKLDNTNATVAVIFCKADGTSADWAKLMTASGSDGSPTAPPPLREYQFPDGTGSIGLADGWTTKATSCNGVVVIEGPADQAITMGFTLSAVTPNSTIVRMNQQLNANARMMGGQQLPLNLYVAPITGPVQALANLMPQISRRAQESTGTTLVMDNLTQVREVQAMLPGGRAAVCQYGLTVVKDGKQKHHHVMAQVEVDPIGGTGESFMFCLTGASSPDANFNRDLPTMLAIIGSLKENAAVIAAQTRQQIDAQNRRFEAQQQAHREVQAAFDDYLKSQQRNSVIRSRSVDDFDEAIRGYRTVEDTRTGQRTSVDLGNVDHIVDTLNQYDPGRYKQIPLRDESDPLPGR